MPRFTPLRFVLPGLLLMLSIALACGGDEPSERVAAPAVEPEAGSDEAAILDVLEHVVRAFTVEDWDASLERCDPSLRTMTAEQAEQIIEVTYGGAGVADLNFRNVTFKVFDDGTALTSSDVYRLDELVFENVQQSWHAGEGKWYSDTFCQLAGNVFSGGARSPKFRSS